MKDSDTGFQREIAKYARMELEIVPHVYNNHIAATSKLVWPKVLPPVDRKFSLVNRIRNRLAVLATHDPDVMALLRERAAYSCAEASDR